MMNNPIDFDVLKELAKRIPIAVLGFLLFVIGAAGQVPFFNFPVTETPWRIVSAIAGAGLMIWQAYLLWDSQKLPKTELPIGQPPQNVLSRLMLHSSTNQKTELISRTDGLELNFDNYKRPSRSRRYLLSLNELRGILKNHDIDVTEHSTKGPKFGKIKIGRLLGWLYNRKMHENPDVLQREIYSLVQNSVNNSR